MPRNDTRNRARAISPLQGVRLIATREITTALRSPAIIWSLLSMILIVLLGVFGGRYFGEVMESMFGGDDDALSIGTTLSAEELPAGYLDAPLTRIASVPEGVEQVRSGELDALIITGPEALGITLYQQDGEALPAEVVGAAPSYVIIGDESVPDSLVGQLTISPVTGLLEVEAETIPEMAMMFVALGFGLVFFAVVVLFAQRLSQSIVEEKASRIVELLISTLKPSTILAGKIVGGTVLALIQVGTIAIVLVTALAGAGQLGAVPEVGGAVAWFTVLTVLGFMFYAALYAALSSTVSRPEDVASVTAPMTYLLMVPYMVPMFGFRNEAVMSWLSYLPFSSPVAMAVRLVQGNAAWWEPVAALAILLVALGAVIWLAGRIYHNSVLRTGAKVKLIEAIRGS